MQRGVFLTQIRPLPIAKYRLYYCIETRIFVKKKWSVEMTKEAEKRLRTDFNSGQITDIDIKVIKRWIADIEDQGLEFTQHKADWRDHQLVGEWKGHRSISFSFSGRVIYKAENEKVIVRVVRVTASHDYKK